MALDKTAPFGSLTVPLMLPLVVWAKMRWVRKRVSEDRAKSFSNRTHIFNLRTLSWRTDGKGSCWPVDREAVAMGHHPNDPATSCNENLRSGLKPGSPSLFSQLVSYFKECF